MSTLNYNKILLLLVTIISTNISIYAQSKNALKYFSNTAFIQSDNSNSILVSEYPVTNREYITYILWTQNVFGADYPEIVMSTFPNTPISSNHLFKASYDSTIQTKQEKDFFNSYDAYSDNLITAMVDYIGGFVKSYMFNPDFIDYPVIGLNSLQASRYNKWLSDRYNEFTLIKRGYLEHYWHQINEDHFETETWFASMYQSGKMKDYQPFWDNKIYIPNFRLPTNQEVSSYKNNISSTLSKYDNNKKEYFLTPWINYYMKESNTSSELLIVENPGMKPIRYIKFTKPETNWDYSKINFKELTYDELNINNYKKRPITYYLKGEVMVDAWGIKGAKGYLGGDEEPKDALGQMNFLITEYKDALPMCIGNYLQKDVLVNTTEKMTIFRPVLKMYPKQFKQ